MKLRIILGTRPEIIKMCPVIRACEQQNVDYFILHTGQHYSYNMDRIFFEQLKLPEAKYNLDVGSGTHGEQTGKILAGVEQVLQEEQPDVVLVEGNTNTVLAGALAATKLHIKVGHVGPGLRSYDRQMPEGINRVLTEHFLFQTLGRFDHTASLNDNWANPSGNGKAGKRIIKILVDLDWGYYA
jgi:UDP-N-acetylglucosamine 2-epimerase (non-hydrolysing)